MDDQAFKEVHLGRPTTADPTVAGALASRADRAVLSQSWDRQTAAAPLRTARRPRPVSSSASELQAAAKPDKLRLPPHARIYQRAVFGAAGCAWKAQGGTDGLPERDSLGPGGPQALTAGPSGGFVLPAVAGTEWLTG